MLSHSAFSILWIRSALIWKESIIKSLIDILKFQLCLKTNEYKNQAFGEAKKPSGIASLQIQNNPKRNKKINKKYTQC